ncbi:uncharacterized protein K452DRAFT_235039 [Aplosporella prunicola CBS 121167]|uniref:Zn(2)-C6 fungal-type domain-containing protein n=1 Tax=Aplosporella prunicola CBS 121167 TaxID=1176127 RepID=A0A6A6B1Q9_9PEZI|nr:uncharacterized protein K452DRAFT_235039 [Aplosporella prunicola CBS 121167]KAF2138152.1 hypothetical protein K452DRAFT_235039 [Aplosporella prunicola CBS 121167]
MPPKLAACDPCRLSKLACDHSRPVCSRCRDRDKAAACCYRSRPFKKRRVPPHEPRELGFNLTPSTYTPKHYPNPLYQGSSSHTTLFNHLSSESSQKDDQTLHKTLVDDEKVSHGASLIRRFRCPPNVLSWIPIVEEWVSKGVNLALADSFTEQCAQSVRLVLEAEDLEISTKLFFNSCSPLTATTSEEFCAKFCGDNARWETLGLFFTAVSRACLDCTYDDERKRRALSRLAMHYSDLCLETALSLDCLNELQLILQYENFISHSFIDGDQSYCSWRKIGDVVSSLFALGYHEKFDGTPFISSIRQLTFARAYSADKNISVFLGRPPRIHQKYCQVLDRNFQWAQDEKFSYAVDTQWSALCAVLKEDILDLFREEDYDKKIERAGAIQADAEAQWEALPPQFRLEGALKACDRHPVERDFLVSARLNHLHVLFLLRLALVREVPGPDAQLLSISTNMLSVVVEAVVLRESLANSGTSVAWKVVYYGLAAAGILCHALLDKSFGESQVIQDLSVLVAEVNKGALVHIEDPNYALLSRAAQTIKNLLDKVLSNDYDPLSSPTAHEWNLHDFSADFWFHLAEHPFLASPDYEFM